MRKSGPARSPAQVLMNVKEYQLMAEKKLRAVLLQTLC